MIIAIFGISGVGKSFLCNEISNRLNFRKFNKIKVREKRQEEENCSDVIIANEDLLQNLREESKIALELNLFGNTYAFFKQDFESGDNMVLEMNYLFFDKLKQLKSDVFTIYLLPNNFYEAIQRIKERKLKEQEEKIRIEEAYKELDFIKKNNSFLQKFNIVAINTYEHCFVKDIMNKIEKLK